MKVHAKIFEADSFASLVRRPLSSKPTDYPTQTSQRPMLLHQHPLKHALSSQLLGPLDPSRREATPPRCHSHPVLQKFYLKALPALRNCQLKAHPHSM
jgi:hypothetical protein